MIKKYLVNLCFSIYGRWIKNVETMTFLAIMLSFIIYCQPAFSIYDYMTVKELARRLNMVCRPDYTSNRQVLSNGTTEVIVCPGMNTALVNGRLISMAEKATFRRGEVVVPSSVLSKIMEHTRIHHTQVKGNAARFSGVTVVIDPGHGGKDPGAIGPHHLLEKNVNLDVAKRVAAVLRAKGVLVVMTRNDDSFISLAGRVEIAKSQQPCIFVSIHADSAGNRSANGFHILCVGDYYDPIKNGIADARSVELDSRSIGASGAISGKVEAILLGALLEEYEIQGRNLATEIKRSMARSFLPHGDGVKRDIRNLHVLREGRYPRVLIEIGFISNPSYERKLNSSSYRQKIADAIADGIINFLRTSHKHLRAKIYSRTTRANSSFQRGRKR